MLIQSLVSSRKRVLMCAVVGVLSQGAQAAPAVAAEVSEVIVTASRVDEPLVVVTDPRKPRQPVPAQDGADYLKTVPGFNVIRKGGTDGDPVLRGMAASRLGIALDGAQVLGGCGMRMDPPTAYVFLETTTVSSWSRDRRQWSTGPDCRRGASLSNGSWSVSITTTCCWGAVRWVRRRVATT